MSEQQEYHAYRNEVYQGLVLATPKQFATMGLVSGPAPVETSETYLAKERSTMTCTPMQGILALGETQWNTILNYRDTQATWAEKVIVDGAQTWVRNSQNIAFFQYLLGLTDTQVDDLFRVAETIEA